MPSIKEDLANLKFNPRIVPYIYIYNLNIISTKLEDNDFGSKFSPTLKTQDVSVG